MSDIHWYNQHYRKLLIIPAVLILLSLVYLGYFYQQHQDIIRRDVSLLGGTSVTLQTVMTPQEFSEKLSTTFPNIEIRSLTDNAGQQTHLIITVPEEQDVVVEAITTQLGIKLTAENSSIEFTQGSLGNEFYRQLLVSMIFAFLLMALVVFITFGESKIVKAYAALLTLTAMKVTFPSINQVSFIVIFGTMLTLVYGFYVAENSRHRYTLLALFLAFILAYAFPYYLLALIIAALCMVLYARYSAPSLAVLIAAFADILFTLVIINLMGIRVASGGIIAFLMLIGYSVGTDVLLTTRVLHRKNETVNQACKSAFKTGSMMTLTAIVSIAIALFFVYRFETVLNQIFTIILIGLFFDIMNTWCTNVWIIKWYAESKTKYDQHIL
jgi:preprotein translocase subunit SecF